MATDNHTSAIIGAVAVIVAAIIGAATAVSIASQSHSEITQQADPTSSHAATDDPVDPEPDPTAEVIGEDVPMGPVSTTAWVADLDPIVETGVWNGEVAVVRGKTYAHSLTPSLVGVSGSVMSSQFALEGGYHQLTGLLGIVDGGRITGKAFFEVEVDGVVVQQAELAIGSEPTAVDVSLVGARDLVLRVTDISQSAYWTDPAFLNFQLL